MSHHKRDKRGLNLHHTQHIDLPELIHETSIVPSTSQPAFGSYFIIDFKQKGVIIHDLGLEFRVSGITGLTGVQANYPHFCPALFFIDHCEIVLDNRIVDTIYPLNIHNHI